LNEIAPPGQLPRSTALYSAQRDAMDTVFSFVILIGGSTFCWLMVLSPATRRWFNRWSYRFWRMNKQDRRDMDALGLAWHLVAAMFFSLVTIIFICVGLYRWGTR
jgi:hypothetical protein